MCKWNESGEALVHMQISLRHVTVAPPPVGPHVYPAEGTGSTICKPEC